MLIVLGIAIVFWRSSSSSRPGVDKGLVALQAAFRDQRPVEARISGFNYAPVADQRGQTTASDYVQRDRAARLLLDAVSEDPRTETHHALGKYYLAERQFDKAIDQFEAALKLDSQRAQVHSDLGAALFEKGKAYRSEQEHGKEIEEFARSLDHFNTALKLDSSLLEALFNRALLYREMRLLDQAESDWRQYLERDPDSKWASEARQQLLELEKRRTQVSRDKEKFLRDFLSAYERGDDGVAWEVIRRNYTSAGNTITNTLLDSYLDMEAKGESRTSDNNLQALAYVGQLELQRANDTYTSHLARFYSGTNPRQRKALAHARGQMRKGYELFLRANVTDALNYYAQAKQTFDESGAECEAIFAEYRMGHCYVLQPNLKRSDEIFTKLRSASERSNYRWLLNQSLYRTASIRFASNEYSESIDYARRALKQSEQMGDTIGILNALVLLSDQYRTLNDERQAQNFLNSALTLMSEEGAEPIQGWGIFTSIALNLKSRNLYSAALEYQKEALRLALAMEPERPLIISRSYDYLGLIYGSLKNYDVALSNIALAFEAGRKLASEPSGMEMMANSSLHAGDVYRQAGDYPKAVESYERSIRLYEELDYPYFTYPARKGKLLSYIAMGNDPAAEEEIRTVLRLFEQYRSKLTRESQRNTFFDVEQSIYDSAIDFAQSRKRNEQLAFEYSELSRARSLLDAIRRSAQAAEREDSTEVHLPSTSTPLTLSDIQQRMPEQAQIVQYAVLEDKLLIWVVTQANILTREVPLGSVELSEQVRGYLRIVNRPSAATDAEVERSAKELYRVLIKPIEPLLDKTKLLCIVPDKLLHFLPFGALVSDLTKRYLVEDFRLELSPSSTIFVDSSEQASQKIGRAEERLLSVGDPSFDRNAFSSLQRLPSAGREAEEVAAFYKSPRLLLRDDARERTVKSEIVKSNVAHFALHYLMDESSNLFSKMVLAAGRDKDARDKENDGVWQIHEIYKMRLPQTRLVVLSACQTGIEQHYRGEGAVSIARPFIAAGVPIVVASLWPVDSQSTEKLMVSFHRHRTQGHRSTVEALKLAQLELLGGEDSRYRHPYYWAAFTAIGGYTEY
ncbi:MAG TPA: CHAT domain-containing protein [Pyrinomonadaceae bacterium]